MSAGTPWSRAMGNTPDDVLRRVRLYVDGARGCYTTGPGAADFEACVSLVADGLLTREDAPANRSDAGLSHFRLTEKGRTRSFD